MKADKVVIGCLGILLGAAVIVVGFSLSFLLSLGEFVGRLFFEDSGTGNRSDTVLVETHILAGVIIASVVGYLYYSYRKGKNERNGSLRGGE